MNGLAARRRPRGVHQAGATNAGREREPAGERLAQADEVGHDAGVFAGKPFSGAAKAGENFIENQQRAQFVANFSQPRQQFQGRNLDAAASLHRFDQNRPDMFAAKNPADGPFHGGQLGGFFWKRHEVSKLAKLKMKRVAEKIAVGGVKRAVAEAMIRSLEGNHSAPAGGQQRGFESGLNGFKTGIAENDLAGNRVGVWCPGAGGFVQRSKVIRLKSRASSALRACGCTSPMACKSRDICF